MTGYLVLAVAMLLTGAVSGVMAGLLGIGGGIVIVPVMEVVLSFLGVDAAIRMHVAVATSLATIIPTSIASARAHHRRNSVDLALVKRWAIFVLAGALAGSLVATQVHGRTLSAIFAVVALLMAIKLILPLDGRTLAPDVPRRWPVYQTLPAASMLTEWGSALGGSGNSSIPPVAGSMRLARRKYFEGGTSLITCSLSSKVGFFRPMSMSSALNLALLRSTSSRR